MASDLSNIGAEFFNEKKYADALEYYERAEQIAKSSFGQQSAQEAQISRDIAIVYAASKQFDQAQAAYSRAIRCLQGSPAGPETPILASWLHEYANLLRKQRHFSEAEQAEVQAVKVEVRNAIKRNGKTAAGST